MDPLIKAAWCKAEWIGPTQGQIDPVKEVNAAILRVENGFSTREQEATALTGGNWDDNIEQAKIENEKYKAAGFVTALTVAAAGKEGQDGQDGTEKPDE